MENTQNAHSTEQVVTAQKTSWTKFITPAAIVIAGALIATALFMRGTPKPAESNKGIVDSAINQKPTIDVAEVTDTDHIRAGTKDAKVVLIEYSDTECPFCKVFQNTLQKIVAEHSNGDVAWVYRHFPISYGDAPLHKKAAKEAEATECAAELGGADMFWKYLDEVYATTQSNDSLDPAQLPVIATRVGLDKDKFQSCLDSGKYASKIKDSYDAALKAGARGTPYTVIKYNGEYIPLANDQGEGLGALPYDTMKQIVDQLLAKK